MRIRFLTSISGAAGSYTAGDEADWPDDKDAKRLIDAGFAEKASTGRKKVETAAKARKVETATAD